MPAISLRLSAVAFLCLNLVPAIFAALPASFALYPPAFAWRSRGPPQR